MKSLIVNSVELIGLKEKLQSLSSEGKLTETEQGLIYLDIDDGYIHEIHSLLQPHQAEKPPYFDEIYHGVGAHISVFYPEEGFSLKKEDWDRTHSFKVEKLFSADINETRYYVLPAFAPTLTTLRLKYGASKKLPYKDHLIDFHITIGMKNHDF